MRVVIWGWMKWNEMESNGITMIVRWEEYNNDGAMKWCGEWVSEWVIVTTTATTTTKKKKRNRSKKSFSNYLQDLLMVL